ncbi:cholecystokinin receptor-like [Lucilia cuprina]|uniref:cholecystokinin receptor-like n=1 Tax=Lucilia cuprina TaxID=7375 RepID=UPI001F069141|nr:cholecystokinin receptor-like [Lucilia cuprina]
MTITTKEFSDLLQYFSVKNASNHIISLALTVNDSFVVGFKKQSVTFEQPPWDILDGDNTSTSSLFNQYIDNSSTLQYATNDTFLNQTKLSVKKRISTEIPIWLIPCYSIILIFAIVGNLLVASTLFQNRRMRTITNVFLANLAISDMLLGVLCMPITLVGTYLRHFIFGELVCKFIQFAQGKYLSMRLPPLNQHRYSTYICRIY